MPDSLLLLLVASAIGIGWFLGRQEHRTKPPPGIQVGSNVGSPEYFSSLSYLLRDKSEDEVDEFVRSLTVSPQTIETHLALGGLFRRRGEADKAIQIHQKALESPWLETPWPVRLKIELARDYMAAGLLDRAESLLLEVGNSDLMLEQEESLHLLLEIYQQERDWEQAIQISRELLKRGHQHVCVPLAHFYCEIAEEACAAGSEDRARKKIQQALEQDAKCARAVLLLGQIEMQAGNLNAAAAAYESVLRVDANYVPEIIEPLGECYQELGDEEKLIAFLRRCLDENPSISAVLALADLLRKDGDDVLVSHFIAGQLKRRPSVRGLTHLIDVQLNNAEGPARESLEILRGLTRQLVQRRPVYRCNRCGFGGKELHWQCPGCKNWSSVTRIQGIDGE